MQVACVGCVMRRPPTATQVLLCSHRKLTHHSAKDSQDALLGYKDYISIRHFDI